MSHFPYLSFRAGRFTLLQTEVGRVEGGGVEAVRQHPAEVQRDY